MKHNRGNPQLSFEPLTLQNAMQEQAFRELLQYLENNSPFYQKLFLSGNIDIHTVTLTELPTTSKEDLQWNNWDFLCVSKDKIAEYTATSGTLGTPVTIALTASDLERLAYNEYCSFITMGLSETDTVQLLLTLDKQFMAGMAYYQGARKLGAAVVRTGPGSPEMQLEVIKNLGVSTLVAVPSFLLKLIETAKAQGIDLKTLPVKKVLAIGESIYDSEWQKSILQERICKDWPIAIHSTYAATEMQTAFTACNAEAGLHANPELIIVELLDEAGNAVAEEEIGEVTITTLGVEGMPLLRYRTGDLCKHTTKSCACGRHSIRIGPVLGRKKQLIKYKGTSVYPAAIFELLNKETWIENYLIGIHQNSELQDEIRIQVVSKSAHSLEALTGLKATFRAQIRVVPEIEFINAAALLALQFPNGSRKQLKIIDYRP
ncbi:MAG: phenylacetate--CoA ligase family protein [Sphingobacteriales bacterium]|nr:MAG: phenylacetate--CoA ligase family protein [Sphingobacteriales bacterium]